MVRRLLYCSSSCFPLEISSPKPNIPHKINSFLGPSPLCDLVVVSLHRPPGVSSPDLP